jgi:hypothetical protein
MIVIIRIWAPHDTAFLLVLQARAPVPRQQVLRSQVQEQGENTDSQLPFLTFAGWLWFMTMKEIII